MGIKEFFDVELPNGETIGQQGKELTLAELHDELCGDQQLATDVSYIIYNAIKAMGAPSAMTDGKGRPTAHIVTIINKILAFDKAGVETLWVFDSSVPNRMKEKEQKKRKAQRERNVAKATNAAMREKLAFTLTAEIVNETKELLRCLGVPYMEAPEGVEAEGYGAFMSSGPPEERYCLAMLSGDSDVLLFGGTLIRPMKSGTKTAYFRYELAPLLAASGLTRRQFVEMGVALGTDFNDKVRGVGPKTVIPRLKQGKITLTEEQEEVVNYFLDKPTGEPKLVESEYDAAAPRAFLAERNFKLDLWEKRLAKYSKAT